MTANVDNDARKRHNQITFSASLTRMTLRDWRQALNSSPSYRIANGTVRFQAKFVTVTAFIGVMILIVLYNFIHLGTNQTLISSGESYILSFKTKSANSFNRTYPLSFPQFLPQGIQFRIGIIADLDTSSKSISNSDLWISYFKTGSIIWNSSEKRILLSWDENLVTLKSAYGLAGRGMELSELIVFNGKLFTFDDRTGFVYQLVENTVIPWVILTDGNGKQAKGFKTEWATIKDEKLYVGGVGKEWTTDKGDYVNDNPMWIKVISPNGEVKHLNWHDKYKKLRQAVGIEFPGYMIHEAVAWSSYHEKWFFLPRRSSVDRYNDMEDEHKSTNVLISADHNFDSIKVTYIGNIVPLRGFSSFKFIPTTNDNVIIALKSEEYNGTCATYITSFTIDGEILLPETKISDMKYEGIEFI